MMLQVNANASWSHHGSCLFLSTITNHKRIILTNDKGLLADCCILLGVVGDGQFPGVANNFEFPQLTAKI
jgi:hypothetical protein